MSAQKQTGAKWAIAQMRATVRERLASGTATQADVAQVEFEIAWFKERRKTNRLLKKIARRMKRA